MRSKLILVYALFLAVAFGAYACYTHCALKTAKTFYLQVAPLDPLALMSGEYMELSYEFERALKKPYPKTITLYINKDGLATWEPTDTPLVLKTHFNRVRIPHQFYFQEKTGRKYEKSARYVQLKQLPDGRIVIGALADKNFQMIEGEK